AHTTPTKVPSRHIHRLKLRAERKPGGRWNLANLLPLPSCQSVAAPQATITDGTRALAHSPESRRSAASTPTSALVLRNIELEVVPNQQLVAPDQQVDEHAGE